MEEFGVHPKHSHIINGHVPVKHGETPIKAGGRLFVIDGGIYRHTGQRPALRDIH